MSRRRNFIAIGIWASACVLACPTASAQTTGKLRLLVDPGHDFAFVLDGKHRMQSRELDLLEGNHQLQIWAPQRIIVDTTIYVRGGSTRELFIRLPYSPEYLEHQFAMTRFRKKQWLYKALPTVATVAAAGWVALSYRSYRQAGNDLEFANEAYNSSSDPGAIAELKYSDIPAYKEEFQRANTNLIISTSVFAVAAAGTIYSFIRTNRTSVPTFEDKERVRFDGLVWVPSPDGSGTWLAGITLPLR